MKSKFKLVGLNQLRKLKFILNNGIKLYSIKRVDSETITFEVLASDEKKFINFYTEKKLNIEKLSESKSNRIKLFFKTSIVFFICFAVFFAGFLTLISMFLFKIEVNGVNTKIEQEIKDTFSIFTFKGNVDRIEMEKQLKATYNEISLVSVYMKGTTLVVNIKEKNETIETLFKDIISPFDGIVKTINLKSGTAYVKSGDIVREGDILVKNEILINGSLVQTNAEADIEILATIQTNEIFKENRIELKPTGKYVDDVYWTIFGKVIKIKENKKYQYFYMEEIIEKESLFDLIPVYKKMERLYELKKVEISELFSEKEDEIKQRVLDKAIELSKSSDFVSQNVSSIRLAEGIYNVMAVVQFYAVISV